MLATDFTLFQCGVARLTHLAVALALTVLFVPACQVRIYTGLALGAAFLGIVLFDALGRSPNYAGFAGFLVGLSVSAKYNVGLVALIRLLAVAWLGSPGHDRARPLRWIFGGVATSVLITTVLPILILGDVEGFSSQVLDKRSYSATGSVSPLVGMNDLVGKVQSLDLAGALALHATAVAVTVPRMEVLHVT